MIIISWSFVFFALCAAAGWVADADPANYRQLGWLWFIAVQLIMLFFTVIGWFLLIPFCVCWRTAGNAVAKSIKDGRIIDTWVWQPLNWVYGNPEDGVTGVYAFVWVNGVNSPYMPNAPAWWRAWCWSAWRNSADNLKYVFAWQNGPQATILGRRIGWQDFYGRRLPVL